MALDPRIPLGVQPVQTQQPNMLGQYAQIMAIKAAQQEMQGSEEMRNLFAGGANFDDPEFQRKGYMANAKGFQELLGKRATTQKTEMEALGKEIELRRDALVNVNTPEDYLKWHESNHQGKMGNFLKSIGQTPSRESIVAKLSQPGGFEKLKTESALGATRLAQEVYNTQRTRISSGPGYQQAALAREKFEFEKANPGFTLQTLDNGNIAAVNKRTNEVTLLQTPSAAPTSATPPVNALTPPSAAPTSAASLNALINPPVVNQPGAPTIANAAALAPTPLRAAPRPGYQYNAQGQQVPITDPTKVVNTVTDKFGNVSMLNAAGDVIRKVEGMGKPSAGVERQQEREVVSEEGKKSVNRVLGNLYSEYTNLVKSGGITDTRQSVEENISARTGASAVGQLTGSFTGSEAQSFRDSIEQTRPLLLTAIMKATGLSATQLNSNVELQTYLKTATDPKVSIQSNVKALNNISTMFGLGEKFEVPEIPKATSSPKAAKPADAVPPGLPPDIAALWPYISPEDRKLWQK
jgi:hypothetical protein